MQHRTHLPIVAILAALLVVSPSESRASTAPDDAIVASSESTPSEATQSESTPSEATPSEAPSADEAGEAEVEWFTDEFGARYYVTEYAKGIEGRQWMWVGENRIQVQYGVQFDVVDHDEDSFSIKIYERVNVPQKSIEQRQAEKAERERQEQLRREEVAESYRANLVVTDRLKLESFDRGLPQRGQWRNGFDVADMNGDGFQDIVFGAPRKSYPAKPHIFLGNGEGSWRVWKAQYPPLPYDYGDAAVADFNGDGHLDLALGIHLKGLLVLVGDGEGRFQPWSRGIGFEDPGKGGSVSTFSSRAIEVTDWNGDGKPDLLALGEGPKGIARVVAGEGDIKAANGPIFFLNRGNGSWQPKGRDSKVFGDSLALGDFNGDGRQDFVTASNSVDHSILNLGEGESDWETLWVNEARRKSYLRSVAAADLNGDGIDDLVLGFVGREYQIWRTGVDVLFGSKAGEWTRRPLYATEGKEGVYGLAIGDLDGDGQSDIAVATGNGQLELFLGDSSGFFSRENSPELPEELKGCRGYGMRLSDLNGDGRDEIIVGFAGERSGGGGIGNAPGCVDGGSLKVWTALDAPPTPAAAAASR